MYRQNKLKEELDRLRYENKILELESVYLRERINTLKAELYNARLELQNRDLMGRLITKDMLEPRIIKIDEYGFDGSYENSEEGKQKLKEIKEMFNNKD